MKYKGKYKFKVIFHHYILSDHTRILLLLFLLLTVLAEPTHRLKKSTFELFYKYFLQYDHLIMLKSSVTMKSDGMHISRPACSLGESPTTLQPHIWYSWLDFVYSARIERGMYGHLQLRQNQSCACGLSCASYPHWPPTTLKESFDQLVYLQDKHNRHRRYLAQQCWTFTCS